jgi:exopolysaccharide biosynthesis polyprenyl glycosylphosphotransferase
MLGKRRVGWALRLLALDATTLAGCFLLAYGLRRVLSGPFGRETTTPLLWNLWLLGAILPIWLGLLALLGGYGVRWLDRSRARLAGQVSVIGVLLLTTALFLARVEEIYRSLLVFFTAASAVGLWAERRLVQGWLLRRRRDGRWLRHALVVGPEAGVARLIRALEQYPEAGWAVVGWVGMDGPEPERAVAGVRCLGALSDLPDLLQGQRVVDEVFFAVPRDRLDELADALQACEHLGVEARVQVDLYRPAHARPFVEELFGLPFYGFSPHLTREWALFLKRLGDLGGAVVLLGATLPLLVLIGLGIRAASPGPALFRQERAGLRGRRFTMLKLRTMVAGAEERRAELEPLNEMMAAPVFKMRDDPRVTPLGRVLRRTSLDELPQLWNVLTGDMSLVGPRPLPVYEANHIKGAQRRRFAMRPGITGLWQVSGRSSVEFAEWMRLDLEYVDRWSLGLDLRILAQTIAAVLRGRGAY